MSIIKVNKIIPKTLGQVVIEGSLNITGDINGIPSAMLTGMTATTIVKTPHVITRETNIEPNINALMIGPKIEVATNSEIDVSDNSILYIFDPNALKAMPSATMLYATNWQRSSSDFEFIFQNYRWSSIGDPTSDKKPFSKNINPRTGNDYDLDFEQRIRTILPGTRLIWMDDDSSKFFDWKYTFVNAFTLQDQSWEPKGAILTNTAGIPAWNNSTTYGVGNRVTYNGFIWECFISNSNETPTTILFSPPPPALPTPEYWRNTGIPAGSGYNLPISTAFDIFKFSQYSYPRGQWLFKAGVGGVDQEVPYLWGQSNRLSPNIQGKMPVITLNTFMNPNNSNRYPTPFNVQHQMDMLDYINAGLGYNPPVLPKVDIISLGSNIFNIGKCLVHNIQEIPYSSGYDYGQKMVEYVTQIRSNPEPVTANAKIIMQGTAKIWNSSNPYVSKWIYDTINPTNLNEGFIHGFYNPINNPNGVDFNIIALSSSYANEYLSNYVNSLNNTAPFSWATQMGPWQYTSMRNSIIDCKIALGFYGRQNDIKYWYRYVTSTFSPPFPIQGLFQQNADYSWATQTGVFMAMVLTATDPDFTGFQYNGVIEYANCGLSLLYTKTDTFGPNSTDVMDYTSVGWMFTYFLRYFRSDSGALSYTRILKVGSNNSNYGFSINDNVMGVYINSSGVGNTPKHTIILCNYSMDTFNFVDIDTSQLIDLNNWTNIQFRKVYTPLGIYDPINYYAGFGGGSGYVTVEEETPYAPSPAEILSTPLYPTEYLIITAY